MTNDRGMLSSNVDEVSTQGNSKGAVKFGAVVVSCTRSTHDSSSNKAE